MVPIVLRCPSATDLGPGFHTNDLHKDVTRNERIAPLDRIVAVRCLPQLHLVRATKPCTPHIGHTRIGTVSTVHIITIGVRQLVHVTACE
jgi:hypothetical protein